MISLSRRWSRPSSAGRTAAVLAGFTTIFALAAPGIAYADRPKPPTPSESAEPSEPPTTSAPSLSAEPPATDESDAPTTSATNSDNPDKTVRVHSPGTVMCEDLGLGTTLYRINGAKNNKVVGNDKVDTVVKDTDVDKDGDPDSLYVTIKDGTVATAVVAIHGNRANVYEDTFTPGKYGPFYAPKQPNNPQPTVNHRLICGDASSDSPSESPSGSVSPTDSPSGSVAPSESPTAPGGGGGLPVTGLAVGGMVLTGLGMVGAGAAMRALRRRNSEAAEGDDESTDDTDA